MANTMLVSRSKLFLDRTYAIITKVPSANFQFHATCPGEDPIKNTEEIKLPNRLGGIFEHHKTPWDLLNYELDYPICRDLLGIRWPGYWFKKRFVYVPEMEPELVVPDLTGFELKPYVSYRTEEVYNQPFTAKDLFEQVYADKVTESYRENKVEDFEVPPEKIDEARLRALQTGADLFEDYTYDGVRSEMKHVVEFD